MERTLPKTDNWVEIFFSCFLNFINYHQPGFNPFSVFFNYLLFSTRESDFGYLPVSTQTRTFLTSAICGALQMKRLGENKPEVQ